MMYLKQACLSKGERALCIVDLHVQIFFSPAMATNTVTTWSAGPSLFIVKKYTLLHAYSNYPLACHVYAMHLGRDFAEYKVHHYFVTTHAAVVDNFIVCKSTTSVTRIFL